MFIVIIACSSKREPSKKPRTLQSVQVDTLLKERISIRAIAVGENEVWYAADKGRFGKIEIKTGRKFQSRIEKVPAETEFRSIAQTSKYIFVLSVGNPALLYRISKESLKADLVYQENNEKVFYDSMQFRNEKEGIAVGDPIQDCLSIIITHDGGNSWQKMPCTTLPKVANGEAAFAASNSNIVIKKNQLWIVSGGKRSRVFYSADCSKTWNVYETPIVQGSAMTGVFTADFYDQRNGVAAGGNYEMPEQNFGNKIITHDGGKTWQLIAEKQGFGYASCIQYVPDSRGEQLVTVGATGLHYSNDSGNSWKQLLVSKDLYTIRFINANTAVAAGHNQLLLLHFL